MRSFRLAFLLGVVASLARPSAHAGLINFETTPGGAIPQDNAELTTPYILPGGLTNVSFGVFSNNDLANLQNALFEARSTIPLGSQDDTDLQGRPQAAYRTNNINDQDLTPGGEGGNWLLRNRKGPNERDFTTPGVGFLVSYVGALPTSVSGQIWDLDANSQRRERWRVEALGVTNNVLASVLSDFGLLESDSNSLSSKPWTYSFANLGAPIAKVRITYAGDPVGPNDTPPGFGFDNFNSVEPAAVSEPAGVVLVGLGAVALAGWRRMRCCTIKQAL